jgi:hypothetical protein
MGTLWPLIEAHLSNQFSSNFVNSKISLVAIVCRIFKRVKQLQRYGKRHQILIYIIKK